MQIPILCIYLVSGLPWPVLSAIHDDVIHFLPGLSHQASFQQYSGYLDASGTKKFHYWFVESASDPENDPLVLWLNGGPGCSSVSGLLTELGPFWVAPGGDKLVKNPYSWNKNANVLFLESPAGVGFSYSTDGDYLTNDDEVSQDNYLALKYFFSHYPEYINHDFYITGESYAGIYIPTLTVRLLEDPKIRKILKGVAIGNGVTEAKLQANSVIYMLYYHGIIGTNLWRELVTHCCKEGNANDCNFDDNPNDKCDEAVFKADLPAGINPYNLYTTCVDTTNTDQRLAQPLSFMFPKNRRLEKLKEKLKKLIERKHSPDNFYPFCTNDTSTAMYLNKYEVRKALHIPTHLPAWVNCNHTLSFTYKRIYSSMRPQYEKMLDTKVPILVYNGDVDTVCNFLGDQWFVDSLKQPVINERTKWYYTAEDGTTQIGGFVKTFNGITFVTIRGSGHLVPHDQPAASFHMISRFLQNKPITFIES